MCLRVIQLNTFIIYQNLSCEPENNRPACIKLAQDLNRLYMKGFDIE